KGIGAYHENVIFEEAFRLLKNRYTQLRVILDTCLCEYTDHGHCGLIDTNTQNVDNDESLTLLVQTAVSQAKAGADIIAPSNMMDGFVVHIRQDLDDAGYKHIPIMSYGINYASKFYRS